MATKRARLGVVPIFTMDPGTTTGFTKGLYEIDRSLSAFEIVKAGLLEVGEVNEGEEIDSAARLVDIYRDFRKEYSIHPNLFLVFFEDFVLYPGKQHSSVRSGISPARITAFFQGMLYENDVEVRYDSAMAGQAKQKATDERLKQHALWTRGKPHGRDATRHAVLAVARQQKAAGGL